MYHNSLILHLTHLLQLKHFLRNSVKNVKQHIKREVKYTSVYCLLSIQVTESITNVLANEKNLYLKSLCYADAVQPKVFHVLRNVCDF